LSEWRETVFAVRDLFKSWIRGRDTRTRTEEIEQLTQTNGVVTLIAEANEIRGTSSALWIDITSIVQKHLNIHREDQLWKWTAEVTGEVMYARESDNIIVISIMSEHLSKLGRNFKDKDELRIEYVSAGGGDIRITRAALAHLAKKQL
jgi:hypothetical protein